jgi:hypothetical protein
MSRPSIVLTGALVRIYINNKIYKEAQAITYTLDAGEQEIYGIDSPFPQEITSTRSAVTGSVVGLRIRSSGGLQAYNARPLVTDLMKSEYISIRIQDRHSGEDILFIPNAKISQQTFQVNAKGTARLSFNFKGLVGFESLDRS